MTGKELQKLSRRDLLELLVQQEQQKEELKARVAELEELLADRTVDIRNAGTMAEAMLTLNGVFERADAAASQYLDNIKRCSEEQQAAYERIISEAEQKAREILQEAELEKQRRTEIAEPAESTETVEPKEPAKIEVLPTRRKSAVASGRPHPNYAAGPRASSFSGQRRRQVNTDE